MNYLREGDTLVITRLDRLDRSAVYLAQLANRFQEESIDLLVLTGLSVEEATHGLKDTKINKTLIDYFLNASTHFPKDLEIYYWIYPSKKQILIKNVSVLFIKEGRNLVGHLMKFLPLSFWIVNNASEYPPNSVQSLFKNKAMPLDELEQVEIELYRIPPLDFPENPDDNRIIALNSHQAVQANEKI